MSTPDSLYCGAPVRFIGAVPIVPEVPAGETVPTVPDVPPVAAVPIELVPAVAVPAAVPYVEVVPVAPAAPAVPAVPAAPVVAPAAPVPAVAAVPASVAAVPVVPAPIVPAPVVPAAAAAGGIAAAGAPGVVVPAVTFASTNGSDVDPVPPTHPIIVVVEGGGLPAGCCEGDAGVALVCAASTEAAPIANRPPRSDALICTLLTEDFGLIAPRERCKRAASDHLRFRQNRLTLPRLPTVFVKSGARWPLLKLHGGADPDRCNQSITVDRLPACRCNLQANDRRLHTRMPAIHPSIALLLASIDEAFDHASWHGPTLRGALRGVTAEQAEWRPAPGRHSIRELTLHAAYWKYAVRRRLSGDRRGSFALEGSNWFHASPDRSWKDDVALLVEEHRRLRQVIADFPAGALNRPVDARKQTAVYTIRGIAAHDLYHAGQIQLIKRLGAGGAG
jgi:hypothetical protein